MLFADLSFKPAAKVFLSLGLLAFSTLFSLDLRAAAAGVGASTLDEMKQRQSFLQQVLKQAEELSQSGYKSASAVLSCVKNPKSLAGCDKVTASFTSQLRPLATELRLRLALSYRDKTILGNLDLLVDKTSRDETAVKDAFGQAALWGVTDVNKDLNLLKTYKEVKWQKLSETELKQSQQEMTWMVNNARAVIGNSAEAASIARENIRQLLASTFLLESNLFVGRGSVPAPQEFRDLTTQLDGIFSTNILRLKNKRNWNPSSSDIRFRYLVRMQRKAHFAAYRFWMSRMPVVQWIDRANPSRVEIVRALVKVRDNSIREIAELKKRSDVLRRWIGDSANCAGFTDTYMQNPAIMGADGSLPPCLLTPSSLFALLDYSSLVKNVVSYSAQGKIFENALMASTYKNLNSERSLHEASVLLGWGLPTLAICFLAPPLVAVPAALGGGVAISVPGALITGGVGLLTSGVEYLSTERDLNLARARELSTISRDTGIDLASLRSAENDRNFSVLFAPALLVGRYSKILTPQFFKLGQLILVGMSG